MANATQSKECFFPGFLEGLQLFILKDLCSYRAVQKSYGGYLRTFKRFQATSRFHCHRLSCLQIPKRVMPVSPNSRNSLQKSYCWYSYVYGIRRDTGHGVVRVHTLVVYTLVYICIYNSSNSWQKRTISHVSTNLVLEVSVLVRSKYVNTSIPQVWCTWHCCGLLLILRSITYNTYGLCVCMGSAYNTVLLDWLLLLLL